jgi:hypothetical protein
LSSLFNIKKVENMKKTGPILLLMFVFTAVIQAEEAGKYTRKSITYLNKLLPLDQQSSRISGAHTKLILGELKEDVMLKRFDYNPIPANTEKQFISMVNKVELKKGSDNATIFSRLSPVIDNVLLPPILKSMEAQKEMRALNLLTEQQQNSFITDKAKELGITANELKTAMNSAYILIPLAKNFKEGLNKKTGVYSVSLDLGIGIYKVSVKDGNASAKPLFQEFRHASASSTIGKKYQVGNKLLNYRDYAVQSLTQQASSNLKVSIMEINDFKLTSQITTDGGLYVGLNIGKREGVMVDHKYRLIETMEDADGNLEKKNSGWIMISSLKDDNQSTARVIAGRPYLGELLEEFPRLPMEVVIKFRNYPLYVDKAGTDYVLTGFDISNGYGPDITFDYNFGPKIGVSQLFVGIEAGVGFADADGEVNFTENYNSDILGSINTEFNLSIYKKFYLRRAALKFEVAGGYRMIFLNTTLPSNSDESYSLHNDNWGLIPRGGVEVAITPSINIGGDFGYSLAAPTSSWKYYDTKTEKIGDSHALEGAETSLGMSGVVWSAYISWSPAKLKNNPFADLM